MSTLIEIIQKNITTKQPIWRFPAEGAELSLEKLNELSHQYVQILRALGIGNQDKVGLILDNCAEYVALVMALFKINAIIIPLRPRGNKHTKADPYLHKCDAICNFKLLIYGDTADASAFEGLIDRTDKLVLSLADFTSRTGRPEQWQQTSLSNSDIAILQFSSGSTGQPKAVIVTHGMMLAQLTNLLENHARSRHGAPVESSASWMPIHHDMGLFIGVLKPLFVGCHNLLAPPSYYMRNPGRWFLLLAEYRVDFTFTTNSALATTLNLVARKLQDSNVSLDALHMYIAAEKVSPAIVRRCYKALANFKMPQDHLHVGYGMAENALGCTCTRTGTINIVRVVIREDGMVTPMAQDDFDSNSIELVSIGTPDRLHDITIRNEQDHVLPELVLGEINIAGPCVSPGYFHNASASQKAFIDGRFRSGDLGFFYKGEIYFYGRRDDMVIVGGRNLIPEDIEETAEELSFIRPTTTCLLATENDTTGTTELILLIEANSLTPKDTLKNYAATTQRHIYLALEVLITRILFCAKGTVEKTSSGKKRRNVIRTRLINNQLELVGS